MTVTEIATKHDVSRQTIHTYRRTGIFPSPVEGEGSTRLRFREDEVAAFFKANPKQPRKKRRLQPEQGEPVSTTVDPRTAILSDLCHPEWNPVSESRGLSHDDAVKLVNSYRASVVNEVVAALTAKAQELSAEAEQEMRQDLEEKAQVWHEAAEVTRKLKRAKPEA